MSRRRVIAIINQQAAVGCTTLAMQLGQALASSGRKVLLVDMDPAADLSQRCGQAQAAGLADCLLAGSPPVLQPLSTNLSLLAAGKDLAAAEMLQGAGNGTRLRQLLVDLDSDAQLVLLDCPAQGPMLQANALLAADEVVIPLTPDPAAWQGLSQLLPVLHRLQRLKPDKTLLWLALNAMPEQAALTTAFSQLLQRQFPSRLLATVIYDYASHDVATQTQRYQELALDLLTGRTLND